MRDLKYYQEIEWPVTLIQEHDDGDYFVATIKEMPGLIATGDTAEEAISEAKDASNAWLELAIKKGYTIVEPDVSDVYKNFSGKVSLRMPKTLHKRLTKLSKLEEMSLNSYINYVIGLGIESTVTYENISIEPEKYVKNTGEEKYNAIANNIIELPVAS